MSQSLGLARQAPPPNRRSVGARAGRAALLLGFCLGAGLLLACGSRNQCSDGTGCPSGFACQNDQCVAVVSGQLLAVEIVPPTSSTAAPTELPAVTFQGDGVSLTADATATISGMVQPQTTSTLPYSTEAHVVVTLPSRIPGRPALQVATPEMVMNKFTFGLGSSRVDTVVGTFDFLPGTASSQSQPPIPLTAMIEPYLSFTFPAKDEMTVIRGQLVDDQGRPLGGYLARAFSVAQGAQISNTLPTSAVDGSFGLLIPPGAVPAGSDAVTLTLTPPADTALSPPVVDLPQFVSVQTSLAQLAAETQVAPHVYVLPAFAPSSAQPQFSFLVLGDDGQPKSGLTIQFVMTTAVSADGSAKFQASATSDGSGMVKVSLVAGTPTNPLSYEAIVQAPSDGSSGSGVQCIPALPIFVDPTGGLSPPITITLAPKVQLSGTISDSLSAPAVGATVKAMRTSGMAGCPDAMSPAVSTTSGSGGDYRLLVDPGTYTIDVDPPPKATYPRVTLDGVTVSTALVRNIMLPEGQVAMGTVLGPDGAPIAGASVELFKSFCKEAACGATQPPVSLAKVQTDAQGGFQAVVPATLP